MNTEDSNLCSLNKHRYSLISDNYCKSIGDYGKYESRFDGPYGIVYGHDGDLFVSETNNCRLQQFSSDGEFIRQIIYKYKYKYKYFLQPGHVTIDPCDDLFVSDYNEVMSIDQSDCSFREIANKTNDQLLRPTSLAFDHQIDYSLANKEVV